LDSFKERFIFAITLKMVPRSGTFVPSIYLEIRPSEIEIIERIGAVKNNSDRLSSTICPFRGEIQFAESSSWLDFVYIARLLVDLDFIASQLGGRWAGREICS
jgi:hypothetical protein